MRRREWLGFPLVMAGCSVLPERAYQPVRNWPLVVPVPATRPAPPRAPSLLLRPVRAAAGMERRGLQTLQPDGSLLTDSYEEWVASPPEAITDQLQRWLEASGLFAAVVGPGSRLATHYVLEVDLTAFWTIAATSRARADLSFVLIDQRASTAVLQAVVSGGAPATTTSAADRSAAELAALADAFEKIVGRLTATPLHG